MAWYWKVVPEITDIDILEGLPADLDNFECTQWIIYYNRIKAKYGKDRAMLTIQAEGDRVGAWAELHACKYRCSFINFFKSEGLEGGNLFSKLYCASEGVADAVSDVTDAVSGLTDTANKTVQRGGLLLLTVGVAAAGYYFYDKNQKRKKS